jgi:hypothetical protein
MRYRPWGPVEWALSLSSTKSWQFVGVVGTEERSLSSWTYIRQLGLLAGQLLTEIHDVASDKYRNRIKQALDERRAELRRQGGNPSAVLQFGLMSELFVILSLARRAEALGPSVVLDITSFPKRFYFPILRTLMNSTAVKNVLVTYTSAATYAPDDEHNPLYEDMEDWRVLPGFGGSAPEELWIVSIGFLVESLRRYVGDNPNKKIKILVPFPAPLGVLRRTWESVANLEGGHSEIRFEKVRVEPLDMSAAFDRIRSLAGQPEKTLAFAPFGPKPMSAAMCLYAIQRDSSIHYPQPTVYNPDYSQGIKNNDLAEAVTAYWLKHDGENLFNLSL